MMFYLKLAEWVDRLPNIPGSVPCGCQGRKAKLRDWLISQSTKLGANGG